MSLKVKVSFTMIFVLNLLFGQDNSLSTLYTTLNIIDSQSITVFDFSPRVANNKRYNRYDNLIKSTSIKYSLDPNLLKALIKVESNFNHKAVSKSGAIGLCQLMPGTAKMLKVNPWNIDENLDGGARYLSMMLNKFNGDIKKSLWAYNAGPNAVIKNRVPKVSKSYADKVLFQYSDYKYD